MRLARANSITRPIFFLKSGPKFHLAAVRREIEYEKGFKISDLSGWQLCILGHFKALFMLLLKT